MEISGDIENKQDVIGSRITNSIFKSNCNFKETVFKDKEVISTQS
jgi:hypothetical protein